MQIEEFQKRLKECKKSQLMTGSLGLEVVHYLDTNIWEISEKQKSIPERDKVVLKKYNIHFNQESINPLRILFKDPIDSFTIFESQMLYLVFIRKQIPYDYANYHKCIAGKRFIENIKEIKIDR